MGIRKSVSIEGLNNNIIAISPEIRNSGFFPDPAWYFAVLTDDDVVLICSMKETNGEGIYSVRENFSLGEYFRNRLGLPSGAFVKKEYLLRYGRTDVDFYKIDDETYFMDFSVPPRNG